MAVWSVSKLKMQTRNRIGSAIRSWLMITMRMRPHTYTRAQILLCALGIWAAQRSRMLRTPPAGCNEINDVLLKVGALRKFFKGIQGLFQDLPCISTIFQDIQGHSRTVINFQDIPGFPGPVRTLKKIAIWCFPPGVQSLCCPSIGTGFCSRG